MEKKQNPKNNKNNKKLHKRKIIPEIKGKTSPPKDFNEDENDEEIKQKNEETIKNTINFLKNDVNKLNPIEESKINDGKDVTKIEKIDKTNNNIKIIKVEKTNQINRQIKQKNINKINENNNKNNNDLDNQDPYPINKIIRNAIIYSKHETFYKLIILYIEKETEEIRNRIFNELLSDILILSKDKFGNLVIQSLLRDGDKIKIIKIYEILKNDIYELSIDQFGCIVLQTLIEEIDKVDKEKIKIILEKLTNKLDILFSHKYGNHVIQMIIKVSNLNEISDFYNLILENIFKYITDKYASHIIELLLKKYNEYNEDQAQKIIEKIFTQNFLYLCKNEFCNYIVQYILKNYNKYIGYAFQQIKGNIYELSLNKHSSNIVQIIFDQINLEQKDEIGKEIIENDNKNQIYILNLANDIYGNYILQKAIKFCSPVIREVIIQRANNIPKNKREKYWKFIYNAITSL